MKYLALVVLCFSLCANAQEEIIVTGSRINSDYSLPGVVLNIRGDFLLLEVIVINDTRDRESRENEIYQTLENALSAANQANDIELSLVEDDFVISLTEENYRVQLNSGNRPDTSQARIRVKTDISDDNEAENLIRLMEDFVDSIPVVGRTELQVFNSADISIVSPSQYRAEIIELFAQDINLVTSSLGTEYRVIVEGIDQPVQWVRSGALELSLFIPYSYTVLPESVNAVSFFPEY